MRVAIIGAGLAGLTAARQLLAAGNDVVVVEKSRGVGGRTSSRRGANGLRFDHGAPQLQHGTAPLRGLAATADATLTLPAGRTLHITVGVPTMNAPAKALAEGVEVCTQQRVVAISGSDQAWRLEFDAAHPGADPHQAPRGPFDAVLITAPAPQAADLLRTAAPRLAAEAAGVQFDACWSVMSSWSEPLADGAVTAVANDGPIEHATLQSALPGRGTGTQWVVQATPSWSAAQLEAPEAEAAAALLAALSQALGNNLPPPDHLAAHRWRYARPATPLTAPFLRNGTLLAAGDWCGGADAAAAIASGRAAADALLG